MSIISGSKKKITNKIDPFCFWFRVFTDPLKPITEFLRLAIPAFNSNFVWETHTEKYTIHFTSITSLIYHPQQQGTLEYLKIKLQPQRTKFARCENI